MAITTASIFGNLPQSQTNDGKIVLNNDGTSYRSTSSLSEIIAAAGGGGGGDYTPGSMIDITNNTINIKNNNCVISGENAIAVGSETSAIGDYSVAEGEQTSAIGYASHTEGYATIANLDCAHAEGQMTSALGQESHAEGWCTIANDEGMHTQGKYNKTSANAAFVIGNGTEENDVVTRSDAFVVDWNGVASAVNLKTSAGQVMTEPTLTAGKQYSYTTTGWHEFTLPEVPTISAENGITAATGTGADTGKIIVGIDTTNYKLLTTAEYNELTAAVQIVATNSAKWVLTN